MAPLDIIADSIGTRKVEIYPVGIILTTKGPNAGDCVGGGKRGKVVGFSRASARRLREKLVCYDYTGAFAMALTSPPYTCREPERVLGGIRKHLGRYGVEALVWRKEVTKVGRPHYHLVVWPSDGVLPAVAFAALVEAWVRGLFRGRFDLQDYERLANPRDGASERAFMDYVLRCGMGVAGKDVLSVLRADCRKVNASERNYRVIDESIGYIRYLLDHTSKHKDYQSQTVGRCWGVQGDPPLADCRWLRLSYAEQMLVLRCMRKATRYRRKADCVFGHKRDYGRRFSYLLGGGRTVQFGASYARLVDWCRGAAASADERGIDAPAAMHACGGAARSGCN